MNQTNASPAEQLQYIDVILESMSTGKSFDSVPRYFISKCTGKTTDELHALRTELLRAVDQNRSKT